MKQAKKLILLVMTTTLLTAAFFFGVGIMALIFRIFQISLIPKTSGSSSWMTPTGSSNSQKMY